MELSHQKRLQKRRIGGAYLFSISFVLVSFFIGISIGSVHIPLIDTVKIVTKIGFVSTDELQQFSSLLWSIRIPRVILTLMIGAALALAGSALQGLLQNPLADPYTLGVSSGASLGAVIVLFFNLQIPFLGMFTLPFMSFVTALLSLLFILFFAHVVLKRMTTESMILIGVITSAFLGALISLVIALSGDELRQIVNWLLGSVSMRGWSYVNIFLPFFIVGTILLLLCSKELNALLFGEEIAQSLGIKVGAYKVIILIASSILTGGAVAVSGTIGFVGLIVPHATRFLVGSDHRHLLPLAMLNGGAFLVIADLLSRVLIEPRELPIGVITSIIGGPVFAILLLKKYRQQA
ncbi:FecCD family ABC transporter permease [Priestia koreensis]|uniref:FecCD family ABC transporter permease n=1 Tax=Priestia koreensis TaxID=284581 RepID=UPI001F5A2534|nr:iron ABC transporter permease [Priestia koreensis]MCM3003957.1 iron ABC transporter permease [Priestia koreensis]UNL84054.1 iron ABC transporter permease [Priestia koreensis]